MRTGVLFLSLALIVVASSLLPAQEQKHTEIPNWGTVVDSSGDVTIRPTEKVTFTVPAGLHDLWKGQKDERHRFNAPRVMQDVEGDFVVQVKVSTDSNPGAGAADIARLQQMTGIPGTHPYHGAGLLVWDSEQHFIRFERNQIVHANGIHLTGPWYVRDGKRISDVKFTKDKQYPGRSTWLRIQRAGDKVTTAMSHDGKQWKDTVTLTTTLPKSVQVGVSAVNVSPHEFVVEFESFTLNRISATFSIVAVDPETGVCGAAVASKYPAVGKVVPYVRADVGAFCTQHYHVPGWGKSALDLLQEGKRSHEVLSELLREDKSPGQRQLAIIDMDGRAAVHNPTDAPEGSRYWGAMTGRFYCCQGNTLKGREVIVEMSRGFEETKGSLADRLMAALIAGDCAGGDHRGRLAAGIRVAKKGVEGDWLALDVDKSDDAVIDLAKKYAELEHAAKGDWRGGKLPFEHPCPSKR